MATSQSLMATLKYALGLGLGALLLWLAFRDLNWAALQAGLSQVSLPWVLLGLVAMVMAHMLRAYRWRLLLRAAEAEVPAPSAFHALMAGYMVNYAVPRLGELTRCTLIFRRHGVPVATSLGTVLTERLLDVIMLLGLLFVLLITEAGAMAELFAGATTKLEAVPAWVWVLLAALGLGALVLVGRLWQRYRTRLDQWPLAQRLVGFLLQMGQAVLSIRRSDRPLALVLSSLGIWFCYVLNTWWVLLAMPPFEGASLYLAFFLTAIGAIGMSLPVPGGIGSYHSLIVFGAALQGYTRDAGQEAALLLHTSGLVVNVILGLVGWLMLASIRPTERSV